MSDVPITFGSGQASVATERIGARDYQIIKVVGAETGSTSVMGVNPDRSINVSVLGIPNFRASSIISIPGIVSVVNSSTSTLGGNAVFTGTSEEVKDFGSITISIFADQASATDGLSFQQSSDATNWDNTDVYTVTASTGKTFSVQPSARYFRVVYTNGATPQGAFRLQTVYHVITTKSSSQRASDGYTNETDLEQDQSFGMLYNGVNWDRIRGNSSIGTLVSTGSSSVITRQSGTVITSITGIIQASVQGTVSVAGGTISITTASVSGTVGASIVGQLPAGTAPIGSVATLQGTNPWITLNTGSIITINTGSIVAVSQGSVVTVFQSSSILAVPVGSVITVFQAPSIVGTYAEDAASASGDKGFLVMGARNDTLASVTSADGDYSSHVVGPAGELIAENAPLTKWVMGTADLRGNSGGSVAVIAAQGASIFTYITGLQVANLGSASVLVTLSGATSSIIGYTIAPAGGGSNIYYQNGIKTNANGAFAASISGISSVLISAQGFISKT